MYNYCTIQVADTDQLKLKMYNFCIVYFSDFHPFILVHLHIYIFRETLKCPLQSWKRDVMWYHQSLRLTNINNDQFYEIEVDLYSFNRKLQEGTTEQLLFYFYIFYTTLQIFFKKFHLAPLAIRPLFQFNPFFELFGYGFVYCTCHCV